MKWVENLTQIERGLFRPMNGNANELIGIGRIIKAGFSCSRVDVTNAKYDAVIDLGGYKRLLRIQIKGVRDGKAISFKGGFRSGKQFKDDMEDRSYKYTREDCDIILGVDSDDGLCYIIPIDDIKDWKQTKQLSQLQYYKENWNLLLRLLP